VALELGDVALDGVDLVGRVVELLSDGRLSPRVRAAERSDEERGANDERAMAGADEGTDRQSAEGAESHGNESGGIAPLQRNAAVRGKLMPLAWQCEVEFAG